MFSNELSSRGSRIYLSTMPCQTIYYVVRREVADWLPPHLGGLRMSSGSLPDIKPPNCVTTVSRTTVYRAQENQASFFSSRLKSQNLNPRASSTTLGLFQSWHKSRTCSRSRSRVRRSYIDHKPSETSFTSADAAERH